MLHGAAQAGLEEKVTSEQLCEQGEEVNQQHPEEECPRQWSTIHSKCKGPEAEQCRCVRSSKEASVAGEESVRGEGMR